MIIDFQKEKALLYGEEPFREPFSQNELWKEGIYLGVDGCKGGWIAAILEKGEVLLEPHDTLESIVTAHPLFQRLLIDMPIGLPDKKEDVRPEGAARKELGSRANTIFSVPCRQAVYAKGEEEQKKVNLLVLGKSLSKQSLGILPKIREVDSFLKNHGQYRDLILESHPEVDFARLHGSPILTNKKDYDGQKERWTLLSSFWEILPRSYFSELSKHLRCQIDDLYDALCLAITAGMDVNGQCETIPPTPQKDSEGLTMQFVVPVYQEEPYFI